MLTAGSLNDENDIYESKINYSLTWQNDWYGCGGWRRAVDSRSDRGPGRRKYSAGDGTEWSLSIKILTFFFLIGPAPCRYCWARLWKCAQHTTNAYCHQEWLAIRRQFNVGREYSLCLAFISASSWWAVCSSVRCWSPIAKRNVLRSSNGDIPNDFICNHRILCNPWLPTIWI